jgi:ankyrin repeat protein
MSTDRGDRADRIGPESVTMTRNRRENHRQFAAAHRAYCEGDMAGLRAALGDPPDFPNCLQPFDLALSDYPLSYAIFWSPLPFIAALLDLGADPNFPDQDGFPALLTAIDREQADKHDLLKLLLERGADLGRRGINDWTPLHYAVARRDVGAIEILLAHGADPTLRTRIDDCTTALEDADAVGFAEAVTLLRGALAQATSR